LKPLRTLAFAAALIGIAAPAAAQSAPEWAMQAEDSALAFTASQSGSPVKGRFQQFQATIFFDPDDPAAGSLEVMIAMASATTDDSSRDQTLKGADLFHVEAHPQAVFKAERFEAAEGEGAFVAPGELTLRGVTNPLALPFTLEVDGDGAGATARAQGAVTINRLDYGVGQGDWKDTGAVADPVEITIDVTAVRK